MGVSRAGSFPIEPVPDPWEAFAVALARQREEEGLATAAVEASRLPFRVWADLVPEPRGPLDFDRFAYQRELYDERAEDEREIVYVKATQVGISTLTVRWALYHADVHGRTALYTFPTDRELGDFSRQRIGPVIRASAHLKSRMARDAIDTVGQKQVGVGWVYFRGTNKPVDSIDADVVVFDEYDSSVQAHIEASEYRVSGPLSAGLLRRVGVPTVPGFGISAAFETSDQRAWTVRCAACGHQNRIEGSAAFASNVDQDAMAMVCAKCRQRLDLRVGEWVARYPDRDTRGYHVPKLIVPGARIDQVVANSRKTRPDQREAFHNRDLGEAYAPAEGRLSVEQIRACVDEDLRPLPALQSDRLVTMGVDMASARALNVVIEEAVSAEAGRKVFVGEVEDEPGGMKAFERLCWLMQAYGVNMCGIDNEPDGRFSQAFAARFPGRVYRCDFFTPAPGGRSDTIEWNVNDAERFVSLWRTRFYDAMLERFRCGEILLPPLDSLPADYPAQLGAVVRRAVETGGGNFRVTYVHTGPHDYAQCEVYNLAAIELFWRNRGLAELDGRGLVALEEHVPGFEPVDLSTFSTGDYRPGFEGP